MNSNLFSRANKTKIKTRSTRCWATHLNFVVYAAMRFGKSPNRAIHDVDVQSKKPKKQKYFSSNEFSLGNFFLVAKCVSYCLCGCVWLVITLILLFAFSVFFSSIVCSCSWVMLFWFVLVLVCIIMKYVELQKKTWNVYIAVGFVNR